MRLTLFGLFLFGCRSEAPKPSYVEDLEFGLGDNPDMDGDGFGYDEDCDDNDASVNGNIDEVCDGIDNNCDGQIDEGVTQTFYLDSDGDGFGDANDSIEACEAPSGYVPVGTDCDDNAAEIYPGAPEFCDGIDSNCDGEADDSAQQTFYTDTDGDGFGDPNAPVTSCEDGPGAVDNADDCDDSNADVNPDMEEFCDGLDNDCNGDIDEGVTQTFYLDNDGDWYGSSQSIEACEMPPGYVNNASDCDDSNTFINPSALEVCDYIDNDCNGLADEGLGQFQYADTDGDGFGDPTVSLEACAPINGYVSNNTDCDDGNANINPNESEVCNGIDDDCSGAADDGLTFTDYYTDSDNDGFGDASTGQNLCEQPSGTVTNSTDCDDGNANINPNESEVCNGIDDDCSGAADDGLTFTDYYTDADNDGFGNPNISYNACVQPNGTVTNSTDCDDGNGSVNPNATEVCNNIDDDCDGTIDLNAVDEVAYYPDYDGDSYGSGTPIFQCGQPLGFSSSNTDCNDTDSSINPGAAEVCNNIDDDCNNQIDDGIPTNTYYADGDGDGFGLLSNAVSSCAQPSGTVTNSTDCDDGNVNINPNESEVCNGIDDDCSGIADDGLAFTTYYTDSDGDGFGNPQSSSSECAQPNGTVTNNTDCDDGNGSVNPNATEVCNNIDDDCDGFVDESSNNNTPQWYYDADGDGFGDGLPVSSCNQPTGYVAQDGDCDDGDDTVYPGAFEACDGYDNDCDGTIDSAAECPCNFELYGNSSYLFCTSARSWYNAQTYCSDYGYHMVTITSESENSWVDATADSYSTAKWWIGINDLAQEGNFQWEDGTPVSYTKWYPTEPNNAGGNEDCGQHNRYSNGYWNDEPCSDSFRFICEANP